MIQFFGSHEVNPGRIDIELPNMQVVMELAETPRGIDRSILNIAVKPVVCVTDPGCPDFRTSTFDLVLKTELNDGFSTSSVEPLSFDTPKHSVPFYHLPGYIKGVEASIFQTSLSGDRNEIVGIKVTPGRLILQRLGNIIPDKQIIS